MGKEGIKIIATNKTASRDYEILEKFDKIGLLFKNNPNCKLVRLNN